MISRYEAIINGTPLSQISPLIIIHDIGHSIAAPSINTKELIRRNGSIVGNERYSGSSVTITFEIHAYSIQERQEICQKIISWAKGTILETNDRNGQRIYVRCVSYPMVTSAMRWTDPITMTFTAFEHPFWEEKTPSAVTLTAGTSGSGTLFVPGNAGEAVVEVTATPADSSADLSFTVGDTTITLTGCNATSSNPLKITYDSKGFQSIKVGTTSVLDKRTGSDDLLAVCGEINNVSFTASASTEVTFSVRGLWM